MEHYRSILRESAKGLPASGCTTKLNIMKSWKTTFVGILGLLTILIVTALLFLKIITATEAGLILGAVGSFIGTLAALLAKDYNATGKP